MKNTSNRDTLHGFHMGERVLYFDCSAGVSGDMTLAALVDVGVPFKDLRAELDKLNVSGYRIVRSKARRGGIHGTRVRVEAPGDRGHRHWADFERRRQGARALPHSEGLRSRGHRAWKVP